MTKLILQEETFPIAETGRVIFFSKEKYTNSDTLIAQDLDENNEIAYSVESTFMEEEGLKKGWNLYILVEKNNTNAY